MSKKRRPGSSGSGSNGSGSNTPASGSLPSGTGPGGSSEPGAGTRGTGAPRREPRIGRRTIPPDAAATDAPRTVPAGLRSAGTRSGRSGQARPRTKPPAAPSGRPRDRADAPARRSGGIMAAFRAPSVFPKLGETLFAGARAVLGSPVLILGTMLLVLAMWFGLLAAGLDHVPLIFQNLMALPPLSSLFDLNAAYTIVGFGTATVVLILVFTAIRAVIFAVLTSLIVQRLDEGRASMEGVLRGLRCTPAFAGIFFVEIALIFAAQAFQQVLGASIGQLLFFAALVGGMHFLVFAPIIVVRDGTRARVALGTSTRAARLPGSRHVGLVLLYFTVAFLAPAFVPSNGAFTVNPSIGTWAMLLGISVVHLVFLGGFAYRYGVIEEDVPAPRARAARSRSALFGGRR